MNVWKKIPFLLVLALLPFAAGCDDDDDNPAAPAPDMTMVRVGHLSPDAPTVDVWVDGSVALEDVPFGVLSGYLELAPGSHTVQVTPANQIQPVVIDETVDLTAGTFYTVAATGLLADIEATVLVDDNSVAQGGARVRFVHASPDAPNVDITLTDGTVLFADVPFRGVAAYLSAAAAPTTLQVRVAGTDAVVLTFADVPLTAGTVYTVFATGRLSDGSLTAQVAVDAPGEGAGLLELEPATTGLRVGHLSPDAPNVDVWLDGAPVAALTNVPYGVVSGYLNVSAASHDVAVYVTGTSVDPVIEATLTLLPDRDYTVVATGLVGQNDLHPVVLEDPRLTPSMGESLVRFVHASADAPAVDIVVADGGPTLFSSVDFRGFAGYDGVGAGSYDLEVRLSGGGALALAVDGLVLEEGTLYTVFAIGLAGDETLAALPVADDR